MPFQAQLDGTDCGAAALCMVARLHGMDVDMGELRSTLDTVRGGTTARSLLDAARSLGLRARGVHTTVTGLRKLSAGAILFWRNNHYVVLEGIGSTAAVVVDPAVGRMRVDIEDVTEFYSGVAIEVLPVETAGKSSSRRTRRRNHGRRTWSYARLFIPASRRWMVALGCSVLLAFSTALLPLFVNRLTDVDSSADTIEWWPLVAISLLVTVVYGALHIGRTQALVMLQGMSDSSSTIRILDRLLRSPLSFLGTRTTGDLLMRIRTSYVVRDAMSSAAVSAVFDGLLVLVYSVVLVLIDLVLGLIMLGLLVVQTLVLIGVWQRQELLNASAVDEQGRAQGDLIEILQGLPLLKTLGLERAAAERWTRSLEREVRTRTAMRRNLGTASALTTSVQFAAPLIVLAVGYGQVVADPQALGLVLAFSTVAVSLFAPFASMVQTFLQLAALRAHFARLTNIMEAPQEPGDADGKPLESVTGAISFRRVSFGHFSHQPIVSEVTVDIAPGQMAVITGPSGAGKSTFALLAAGLHTPSDGIVLLDGIDVSTIARPSLRRHVGFVAQTTSFFTGTIRDNIDLGRGHTDHEVQAAADRVGLHTLIEAMPMRYNTPFTAGMTTLSGGQLQRLALARALIGRPRVVVLDEATNALDVESEALIIDRIVASGCTVLLISHRPYLGSSDYVHLVVSEGQVRRVTATERAAELAR